MTHLKKNKLEKLRGIFFQFGLIVAGGITLLAFEWTSPKYAYELPPAENVLDDGIWEYPPLPPEKEIVKPKVKITQPKLITDAFKKVDDDTKIIDEKKTDPIEPVEPFDPGKYKEPIEVDPNPAPLPFAEKMPEFIGGLEMMNKYLGNNIKYPSNARTAGIQGKVYVQFVVGKDGEIRDIKIIRGVNKWLDEEAIRVVKAMPKWSPGKQSGRPVSVLFNLPINFKLKG